MDEERIEPLIKKNDPTRGSRKQAKVGCVMVFLNRYLHAATLDGTLYSLLSSFPSKILASHYRTIS